MINKIKDIPEGTEVWVKMKRKEGLHDNDEYIRFNVVGEVGDHAYLGDENEVLTEEQMRERFSVNDGMPKQGDIVEVRDYEGCWYKRIFVSFYKGKVVVTNELGYLNIFDELKSPSKKIQKTLAELEKELGYEEGTLEITN